MNAQASDRAPLCKALHEQLRRFYDEEVAHLIRGKY
jgi:hypothetical protein